MDTTVFLEWTKEPLNFDCMYDGKKRVIFMEDAGGHKITEKVKPALN